MLMTNKYQVVWTSQFKRDHKTAIKQGKRISRLYDVIEKLANGVALDFQYNDHALAGSFAGCRECHIQPDWLLVYMIENETLVLTLTRTGSHSEIFGR